MLKVGILGGGVGGFDMAVNQAKVKCKISFVIESDEFCRKIYRDNSNQVKKLSESVSSIKTNDSKLDILLCSKQEKNNYSDIYYLVERFSPEIVITENSLEIDNFKKVNFKESISKFFKTLGYNISWSILDASVYGGVPQNRRRLYLIAIKGKLPPFEYNVKPHYIKTSDIVKFDSETPMEYYLEDQWKYTDIKKERIYSIRGETILCSPNDYSYTLCLSNTGGLTLPCVRDSIGVRKLTERECLRFMGLRPDMKLSGKQINNYRCICKSIVPLVFVNILNNIL